ncbi:hypothetical protein J6590_047211 [Homalodisca vitripennis]|nr:hypothetical protein J6590_047211 [Homalodisca vitripennis]
MLRIVYWRRKVIDRRRLGSRTEVPREQVPMKKLIREIRGQQLQDRSVWWGRGSRKSPDHFLHLASAKHNFAHYEKDTGFITCNGGGTAAGRGSSGTEGWKSWKREADPD